MPADSERIEDGLSRRQVLARGAVAAGVVWAAPVIRTATAYATSAAGTERPCTNFYVVCIDPLGVRPVRFPADQPGYDDISPAALAQETSTTSSTTTTSTSTTTTSTSTTTTTAPAASTSPKAKDAAGSDATPMPTTTTVPDPLGLFPDPGTAAPASPTPPVDPHVLSLAAAQGAQDAGAPDNLPPGLKSWLNTNPDVPVRYPDALPALTQAGDEAWAVLLQAVDGPDPLTHQCRPVDGWAQSKGKFAEFYLDPNPDNPDELGRRLIFPNPHADDLVQDPNALIENVIFIYCCPQ